MEGITPSERLEAEEKARNYQEGKKEAEFYRLVLDDLASSVASQLNREDFNEDLGDINLETTDHKLKDFKYCDANSITEYIKEGANNAKETTGLDINFKFNPTDLAEMTPDEFFNYIETTKASLIK